MKVDYEIRKSARNPNAICSCDVFVRGAGIVGQVDTVMGRVGAYFGPVRSRVWRAYALDGTEVPSDPRFNNAMDGAWDKRRTAIRSLLMVHMS